MTYDNFFCGVYSYLKSTEEILNECVCLVFLQSRYEYKTLQMGAHSLVVRDLCSETKGSRFEFGCYLCAEVSSPHQSPS